MQGFQKTGLGERVANIFVKLCGKSTLGLAYGLLFAEALIAPAMPSTTARAGGIFMPIIDSLSRTAGSIPGNSLPQYIISESRLKCPFLPSSSVFPPANYFLCCTSPSVLTSISLFSVPHRSGFFLCELMPSVFFSSHSVSSLCLYLGALCTFDL
jgi:hypothetical protein